MITPPPHTTLLPRPTKSRFKSGHFTLTQETCLRVGKGAEPAADLLRTTLAAATGLPLRTAADGAVVLALDSALTGLGGEGYGLTIGPESVLLRAREVTGLLRGVQTIRQLLPAQALSAAPQRDTPWSLPCAEITDLPHRPWRGAMLDVARHFQPLPFLLRYVDLLALHKINVFHLHLTDDQGWRMPVAAYPKLTEIGGHRLQSLIGPTGERYDGVPHGGAYTRAELARLVEYAAARGITVMPEIEMPGHTRAALAAYPHLGNHPDRVLDVWTRWGVCDTILGLHDEVFDFCRTVLDEVMDVFPSHHIHVGGDECPLTEWTQSSVAATRLRETGLSDSTALHRWFLGEVGAHLRLNGRQPVGWAETGTELPDGFTVMAWRDPAHALAAAGRGHQVINSYHRATYFDYPQTSAADEPAGQPGGVVSLRDTHGYEPVPEGATPEAAARVLGTQAQLWTEYATTRERVEYLTFPRLCALADGSWSGPTPWTDFTSRLRGHTARLDALGISRHP
ncbi:beta-N-acetylhexosaminidase [Streptomyces spinosirectus]|uniref:beta-N-acetylhexosaminidase n=1 Tax=Streptomyces TaxID=1883 RepID=UPI000D398AB0|nr:MULTISPECIES: beta-N-acetylhexosaminidase [Streptomyces]MBY8339605.1 beta-N-acetylhexosaminidase [Streptomyces plumbidurans]PTM87126.1 hexosaminidase [Streptomyces sp. VMFN-G11Ma]UIR15682.1 beta-N-acetylhexosaminidase [Streptomyces spinosirectus]